MNMNKSSDQSSKTEKKWFAAIFIWFFLLLFVLFIASALAAGACRSEKYHGEKKLGFCNISITLAALLPREAGKRSIIFLERGIANSEVGKEEAAVADFNRAISDASGGRFDLIRLGATPMSPFTRSLFERIEREGVESIANVLWQKALTEFE